MSLSLYVHVPFCARKCPYCDFNTYAGLQALYQPLTGALVQEIERAGEQHGHPTVHTIFLGGGTPTVLDAAQLAAILTACDRSFGITAGAEITSEANPGTVDQNRFNDLRALGVNRLSLGVQSFQPAELAFLGRIHSAGEAVTAYAAARAAGFANINLDFMFGLPGQTVATWRDTLDQALALGPEHLSLYSLIVEDGTPLAGWVDAGRVAMPDEDLAADQYEEAQARLGTAGYAQYEISNWARATGDGRWRCQHNLTYWRNQDYLGFGPGAFSGLAGRRWSNLRDPSGYVRRTMAGEPTWDWEEVATPRLAMAETMMVGLRLLEEGVDRRRFRARFAQDVLTAYPDQIADLQTRGLLEVTADAVRLTPTAVLVGNQVFKRFLDHTYA